VSIAAWFSLNSRVALGLALLVISTVVSARCENSEPLRKPFFGDLHVHTRLSLDASTQDTRTTPQQAYEFARGSALGIQPFDKETGIARRTIQLDRPLDFAAVTDHAELFGEVVSCTTPGSKGYGSLICRVYRNWPRAAFFLMNTKASDGQRYEFCGEGGAHCLDLAMGPWQEIQQAAEAAYDRSEACSFTTFVAYEWSAVKGRVANLHRNVIFKNDKVPVRPVSSLDALTAKQLYDGLDAACQEGVSGCEAIIIPHNSNLSNGEMFRVSDDNGEVMGVAQAKQIQRYEKLVEIMQHKGSSECYFGPAAMVAADELCAFEQLPYGQIGGNFSSGNPLMKWFMGISAPKPDGGFLREAAREGLRQEARLGVNPFQWGFIGSTDTHLGAPGAVNEATFAGHGGAGVSAGVEVPPGLPDELEYGPGGLAVLWAEENTRESLFAAMQRREAYATSGPRIALRFFGSWDYPRELCSSADFVATGYAQGVPMGGQLSANDDVVAVPHFAVAALKDPGSPQSQTRSLQRLQVIKGWVDDAGRSHEVVVDVAGDENNGASIDAASCQSQGAGFDQLCSVWRDEDFDPQQRAYYYARAVENPSCRWSAQICLANKVDCERPETIGEGLEGCCSDLHRPVIQERAWSSPIWYSPAG
jgi:hypothetical protein